MVSNPFLQFVISKKSRIILIKFHYISKRTSTDFPFDLLKLISEAFEKTTSGKHRNKKAALVSEPRPGWRSSLSLELLSFSVLAVAYFAFVRLSLSFHSLSSDRRRPKKKKRLLRFRSHQLFRVLTTYGIQENSVKCVISTLKAS